MDNKTININCSIDKLKKDIIQTDELIKKTILQRLLDIKLKQEEDQERSNRIMVINKKNVGRKINNILKTQQKSLNMLEVINNIKSKENDTASKKRENDRVILNSVRGKNESKWKSSYDPKYAKYMKEDIMNNRMMERLNSEIDFRQSNYDKSVIEKPFDNMSEIID